ncbi:1-acyl-sn-glycerol-3-phosphate acyltransferase [Neptunomonas sp.]|uniref:1-acyl-sn-glycerol-3-phosphate acyltransferase n=1 Tax=Neptunomonas TaxID=75687 RepID=UPI003514B2EE
MHLVKNIRKLAIHLWIKTNVQGAALLQPDKQRLYILQSGRPSHRLLLRKHLKLNSNKVPNARILSLHDLPSLLKRLESQVEKLSFDPMAPDIQLIPVSIYHGRLPERINLTPLQRLNRWLQRENSLIGHCFQILLNGRQTLLQLDQPLSLKDEIHRHPHQPAGVIAHQIQQALDAHFTKRRIAIRGPELSGRETMLNTVINAPQIRQQIALIATNTGQLVDEVENQARRKLDGIAANLSPSTAKVLEPLLSFLWRKVYNRVHIQGTEQLQACAANHQLVYLPCHKSHMDYLMLSWALYKHGLMIPHVAAGENLNVPVLGSILKRGGAIFMRRRFKGSDLYPHLFKEYLAYMASRGHSLEYFIEGGRSRTGRLLPAKTGLLSMTIENFAKSPDKPVALVPVWISYDKLVESDTYQRELDGAEKSGESFLGAIKTLRKFSHKFGEAALSFGDPILLEQAIDTTNAIRPQIDTLGFQVLQHINSALYANQTALIATVLLTESKLSLPRSRLIASIEQLICVLRKLPNAPRQLAQGDINEWIDLAVERHQLTADQHIISLNEAQAREMSFYRNQLHSLTVLAGCYVMLVKRYEKPTPQNMPRLLQTLYPYLRAELFLPWKQTQTTPAFRELRIGLEENQLLTREDTHLKVVDSHINRVLIRTAELILIRYFIVFRLLTDTGLSTEDLISESQRIALSIHHHFGFHSPEYSDAKMLQLFIDQLFEQEVLTKADDIVMLHNDSKAFIRRARQFLSSSLVTLVERELHRY